MNIIRFKIFISIIIFAFIIIIIRLSFLGLSKVEKETETIKYETPVRGNIFDRSKNIMAASQEVYSVFALPKDFSSDLSSEDKENLIKLLEILHMDSQELIGKIRKNKSFFYIKKDLSKEDGLKIKELKIPGISVEKGYKRYYPSGEIASHIIGFTGAEDVGLEGIEKQYNDILKPKTDPLRPKFQVHLYLTIDKQLQYIVERNIKNAVYKYQAKSASCCIIDSKTGEVLSIANYPTYNLNEFNTLKSEELNSVKKNLAICDYYEPGSVFKIFTTAMLINENLIDINTPIYCAPKLELENQTIFSNGYVGTLPFINVIKISSNVGTAKSSLKIKPNIFLNYLKDFGFGKTTGISIGYENAGRLDVEPKKFTQMAKAFISFGYHVGVTPIQLAMAASVIPNGGLLMKPIIIKRIADENDIDLNYKEITTSPTVIKQVLSKNSTEKVMKILENVVSPGGTGKNAVIPGLKIAGKTGTAQIYDQAKKKYIENDCNATFIGFVPIPKTTLTILVSIKESKTSTMASEVAAPTFRNIVVELLDSGWLLSY